MQLLSLELIPEGNITSFIIPISVSVAKASADYSRLSATISTLSFTKKEILGLSNKVNSNFDNYELNKKDFDLALNNFRKQILGIEEEGLQEDKLKKIKIKVLELYDTSKLLINSYDNLIFYLLELNSYIIENNVSDDEIVLFNKLKEDNYLDIYNLYMKSFNENSVIANKYLYGIQEMVRLFQ